MNTDLWRTLEEQALWLLAHGDQGSPRESIQAMAQELRLWRYLRNGAYTSWGILMPVRENRGKRALVREVTWDRPRDWKRSMGTVEHLKRRPSNDPSLKIRDAELRWTELAPFLDWAAGLPPGLSGPIPPRNSVEHLYGLEGFRSFTHLRFEWAGDGPPAWAPTRLRFLRFLKFLGQELKEREILP